MIEERGGHRLVAADDRLVQRGEAVRRGVGVRALVEQQRHHVAEAGMRGQRCRADAPRIVVVHVRPGRHQQSCGFHIAHARGKHQRRFAAVRNHFVVAQIPVRRHGHHLAPDVGPGVKVRTVRDQRLYDVRMLLRCCPHQRGLAARAVCVHVRAAGDQLLDNRGIPAARGHHQRRFAGEKGGVGIRACREQLPNHRPAAVLGRVPQRRDAEIGRRVHSGAGMNQQVRAFEVVTIGRPVQRSGAVGLGGVDINLFLDQRADRGAVGIFGGIDERRQSPAGPDQQESQGDRC